MSSKQKAILSGCVVLYAIVFCSLIYGVLTDAGLRDSRQMEFSTFSKLFAEIPPLQPSIKSSEPLLVRLQKTVEQLDLKDRAPKWSGKEASQGQPATVTSSLEGVPFDRIAVLLEKFSTEPNIAVPAFLIDRSGASAERFDFSAAFIEQPAGFP